MLGGLSSPICFVRSRAVGISFFSFFLPGILGTLGIWRDDLFHENEAFGKSLRLAIGEDHNWGISPAYM